MQRIHRNDGDGDDDDDADASTGGNGGRGGRTKQKDKKKVRPNPARRKKAKAAKEATEKAAEEAAGAAGAATAGRGTKRSLDEDGGAPTYAEVAGTPPPGPVRETARKARVHNFFLFFFGKPLTVSHEGLSMWRSCDRRALAGPTRPRASVAWVWYEVLHARSNSAAENVWVN